MADNEPAPMSIQARIAALNLNQVAVNSPPSYEDAVRNGNAQQTNGTGQKRRPPPPLPTRGPKGVSAPSPRPEEDEQSDSLRPMLPARRPSPALSNHSGTPKPMLPPRKSTTDLRGTATNESLPPLPTRRPTTDASGDTSAPGTPSLPPRRPSGQSAYDRRVSTASSNGVGSTLGRKQSVESIASTTSTASRRRVLAPDYDRESLPPLPRRTTKTAEEEERDKPRLPKPSLPSRPSINEANKPRQIPPLPGRPSLPSRPESIASERDEATPPLPTRHRPAANGASPPPLPLASKPSLSAAAIASKPVASASCLLCRDFRAADAHAANFPRDSLPNVPDVIGWLARELTSPFDNRTDKARAIFTWLHHNVAYDCDGFFRGHSPIKGMRVTPDVTLRYGIAVCEGYAALFVDIAERAGLRAIKVVGHGKGYGHNPLAPGSPTPPRNATGHAWAAVLLDDNRWKLLDPCWGAGNVNNQVFNKDFNPSMFTMSNESFGDRHFPQDGSQQFRYAEGMREQSWEEYIRGDTADKVHIYNKWEDLGFSRESLQPSMKQISTQGGGHVRFEFTKVCPHFSWTALGTKPYLPVMTVKGRGGNGYMKETWRAMDTDGFNYWVDIPRESLGLPGQKIMLCILEQFNGQDGKGITKRDYDDAMNSGGCSGIKGGGLADWELV